MRVRAVVVVGVVCNLFFLWLQLSHVANFHGRTSQVDVNGQLDAPWRMEKKDAHFSTVNPSFTTSPPTSSFEGIHPTTSPRSIQRVLESPLNDKTLSWPQNVDYAWWNIDRIEDAAAPAIILMTDIGWNHPNQTFGLQQFRSMRSRNLMEEGVLQHEWFHPTAWQDYEEEQLENVTATSASSITSLLFSTRIYVFLDYEICGEKNYPRYGVGQGANADTIDGRNSDWRTYNPKDPFEYVLLKSTLFQRHPDIHMVVLDCGGHGPQYRFLGRQNLPDPRINLASISAGPEHHLPIDQGLPPPILAPIQLTQQQRQDIFQDCNSATRRKRPFFFTFVGNYRHPVRKHLWHLRNASQGIHIGQRRILRTKAVNVSGYEDFMTKTLFGGAPRGDNKFSYRFGEVLAAGAIPVVFANDWVWPLEPLVPWKECCAVDIPEQQVNHTIEILRNISDSRICEMQQNIVRYYDKYFATPKGTIQGLLEGFQILNDRSRGKGSS